jgi:hypothetical protein
MKFWFINNIFNGTVCKLIDTQVGRALGICKPYGLCIQETQYSIRRLWCIPEVDRIRSHALYARLDWVLLSLIHPSTRLHKLHPVSSTAASQLPDSLVETRTQTWVMYWSIARRCVPGKLRVTRKHVTEYFPLTLNVKMSITLLSKSRDSSVGIVLGYGLDDRGSRVPFPAGAGNFSLHDRVQNDSGAHPASYPGARTANGTALCHYVQLYRYFVSQSSEFCRHKPLCCFSMSVCCCLFHYRFSPETFGCTFVNLLHI